MKPSVGEEGVVYPIGSSGDGSKGSADPGQNRITPLLQPFSGACDPRSGSHWVDDFAGCCFEPNKVLAQRAPFTQEGLSEHALI